MGVLEDAHAHNLMVKECLSACVVFIDSEQPEFGCHTTSNSKVIFADKEFFINVRKDACLAGQVFFLWKKKPELIGTSGLL